MHTIALVSQEASTGKGTLAIGRATIAMQDGHKVSLLEADPRGHRSNWRKRRAQPQPVAEPVTAAALSDMATSRNVMGVPAPPYIVLRNDRQDALTAGLAVTEFALGGKSARKSIAPGGGYGAG